MRPSSSVSSRSTSRSSRLDSDTKLASVTRMKAIRIHAHGGPEVLRLDDVPAPAPKAGEVRVRVKAAGVNFIDIYQRKGIYPLTLPYTPGSEGVGIVETAGGGFAVGDRVLWVNQAGSYAEAL